MTPNQVAACPNCQAKLKVGAASAGKKVRCPKCGEPFEVPAASENGVRPSQPTAPPRAKLITNRKDDDDVKPRRGVRRRQDDDDEDDGPERQKSGSKAPLLLLLLGGGGCLTLLLLAGGIVAAVLIIRTNSDSSSSVANTSGSSSSDSPAASSSSEFSLAGLQSDFAKNEAVMKEVINQMNAVNDALESVKDKDSGKQAISKIDQASSRIARLAKLMPTVPKLSQSDDSALQKKYEADLKKAGTRMGPATGQAMQKSGGDVEILNAFTKFQSALGQMQTAAVQAGGK